MSMRRFVAIVAILFATAAVAQQAPKIAVIDVDLLVQDSAAGKEALARLQRLRDEKITQGRKMSQDLEALQQQLQTQRATLSEAKISELQKQIEDKQIELRRYQDDVQQQLSDAQDKEYAALNEQIMPIVNEVGREMGLQLIFNKYRAGLLYADEALDITDQVLRRFNTKVTQ